MGCSDCFSGCVETTSDKCVKYTGNAIEFLDIHTGDSLEAVEKAITDYLATVLTGLGILPTIDPDALCNIVSQYFPQGDPTIVDILTAIIKAICDIEAELIVERERIDAIEADYTVDCLTADPSDGTHVILQEVITALCTAIGDITTLNNLLPLYVLKSEVNTYIQNYINAQTVSAIYTKMVPYVIYPFYPTPAILSSFAITGAGFGAWDKIYFCNGLNGTPDLRGRSLIGVVSGMRAGSYDTEIDPADPSGNNLDYAKGDTNGVNSVALITPQIPTHTHATTVDVTDPGHLSTIMFKFSYGASGSGPLVESINEVPISSSGSAEVGTTSDKLDKTGITAAATNANTGGGEAHDNVHPVYATYYIMYLP